MQSNNLSRRRFLASASAGSVVTFSMGTITGNVQTRVVSKKLAIRGGDPVRTKSFPGWPIWDRKADEASVVNVLRSGVWSRRRVVAEFEKQYAALLGAKHCLTTTHGTTALVTALNGLGIGFGDEVLVGPYTFIATLDAIMLTGALPIMVDTDRETFQVNPDKMDAKITKNTKAILPVHILGIPAHMDKITALATKHNLLIVEDACQAWLAEWRGRKCGTLGDLGCFSFQNSKHLTCGEGGAVVGDNDAIIDMCRSYQNFGRAYGESALSQRGYARLGSKCRMTEFQAAILLAQMKRLEEQTERRWTNGRYLTSKIENIPGILTHKLYDGVTRAAYHLYPFRIDQDKFDGVSRDKFLAALRAEGIPCSRGYGPVNKDPFFEHTLRSKNYRAMYSKQSLNFCREQNNCPDNDQLCREAVWLSQNLLLGTKRDMDDIANGILKVYENRKQLL